MRHTRYLYVPVFGAPLLLVESCVSLLCALVCGQLQFLSASAEKQRVDVKSVHIPADLPCRQHGCCQLLCITWGWPPVHMLHSSAFWAESLCSVSLLYIRR